MWLAVILLAYMPLNYIDKTPGKAIYYGKFSSESACKVTLPYLPKPKNWFWDDYKKYLQCINVVNIPKIGR